MLVSRESEIMSPVPPTIQRPSEMNKRVRAGMADKRWSYESVLEKKEQWCTYPRLGQCTLRWWRQFGCPRRIF